LAGLIGTFDSPVSRAGAFFSDTAPFGDYMFSAFGAGGLLLDSFVLTPADFPTLDNQPAGTCDDTFPWSGTGCGIFIGFEFGENVIHSIQFDPLNDPGLFDAFAIDDFRFETARAVPEPASAVAVAAALLALAARHRRRTRH
jgi:hypothetical protein